MASYNKKQDFEQWLSEHDPDSKKYKYRDKSAYSYIREQKETASIPRTREVERAYAENPAGWENSKNMQAASVVPRAAGSRSLPRPPAIREVLTITRTGKKRSTKERRRNGKRHR